MKKRLLVVTMALVMSAAFCASAAPAAPVVSEWPKFITFTTGAVGGAWYSFGGGMAELMNKAAAPATPASAVSGGGNANVPLVASGGADVGFSYAITFKDAAESTGDFAGQPPITNLSAIGVIHPMYYQLAINRKAFPDAKYVSDILTDPNALNWVPNKRGTGDVWMTDQMLAAHGTSLETLTSQGAKIDYSSFAEAVESWRDGHTNLANFMSVIPTTAIVELTTFSDVDILSIEEDKIEQMRNEYGLPRVVVPAGTYNGIDHDVISVGNNAVLFTRTDMPEDVIYLLLKLLVENEDYMSSIHPSFSDFDPATAWQDTGLALHPGAERYYREAGYIK